MKTLQEDSTSKAAPISKKAKKKAEKKAAPRSHGLSDSKSCSAGPAAPLRVSQLAAEPRSAELY